MVSYFDRVVVVFGPTASGKSSLAMHIAKDLNGAIINADSMQIYDAIPTLTAHPSAEDKQEVDHYLYGVFKPCENNSVGTWLRLVEKKIQKVIQDGKVPIVVGGTGMYISALLKGINHIPAIPEEIKEESRQIYREAGVIGLYEKLINLDPRIHGVISPRDSQRLIRAYDVKRATGLSIVYWWENPEKKHLKYNFCKVFVNPPREKLYSKCNDRFIEMMSGPVVDEVIALRRDYSDISDLSLSKAIGLREISDMLDGKVPMNQMIEQSQQKTRNYAKRQITWFKNQINPDIILDQEEKTAQLKELDEYLKKLV